MKKCLLTFLLSILAVANPLRAQAIFETEIPLLENEVWYGGAVGYGPRMPYATAHGAMDLALPSAGEIAAPLLISTRGRYIRSDKPMRFEIRENSIVVRSNYGIMEPVIAGRTLREAYMAACTKHFPPQDKLPERHIFASPVYETGKNPAGYTQDDIIGFAEEIIAQGLPAGTIVIDDRWQDRYGAFEFARGNFDDPAAMIAKLHEMGFKAILWVSPLVSPDSPGYRQLRDSGFLLKIKNTDNPAIVKWSNGQSACIDMTNPAAAAWAAAELERLSAGYGVDGFRFDCDNAFATMTDIRAYDKDATPADHINAWVRMAAGFPIGDLASGWKMGAEPVAAMLGGGEDIRDALASSVAHATAAGLLGYAYVCPSVDWNAGSEDDEKTLMRLVQINALMPVMRIPQAMIADGDPKTLKNIVELRAKMLPYILEMAENAAKTGEPIIRHMEYSFPGEGFADCQDQFMLGDRYMVAPVLDTNDHRDVRLPKGRWRDDKGQNYRGGTSISIRVPPERLLYFERL